MWIFRLPGDKRFRKPSFFLPEPLLTPALPTWWGLHHGTCQNDVNTGLVWSFTFLLIKGHNQPFGSGRETKVKRKMNMKIPATWSAVSGVTERPTLTFCDCCPQPRLDLESRARAYSSTTTHLSSSQIGCPVLSLSPNPPFRRNWVW